MTTIWTPITPGDTAQSGQVNQFLAPHPTTYVYQGALIASNLSATVASSTSAIWMAQAFNPPSTGAVGYVQLAINPASSGYQQDYIVSIMQNINNAPGGTTYASTMVPGGLNADPVTVLLPTASLPAGSYFLVVETKAHGLAQSAPSWQTTTATTSGISGYILTSPDGTTWTTGSQIAMCALYQNASGGPFIGTYDDNGAKWTLYGSQVVDVTLKSATSQVNLLVPNDAAFTNQIVGTWTSQNATLTVYQLNGVPVMGITTGYINILDEQDSKFTDGVGSWYGNYNATVYQVAQETVQGSDILAIEATGGAAGGGAIAQTGNTYPVVAGAPYIGVAGIKPVSAIRNSIIYFKWSTETSDVNGSFVVQIAELPNQWNWIVGILDAPSNASSMQMQISPANDGLLGNCTGQLASPSAPTVTVEGTTGSTTYSYEVCATNVYGSTPPSSSTSVTTGNATLSTTDYNLVSWDAVPLPAGSGGNLVYDSELTNAIASVGPTWIGRTDYSPTIGTAAGDFNVLYGGTPGAEWVYYGTGATISTLAVIAPGASVSGSTTYTFSALIDATNLSSAGGINVQLYNDSPNPSSAFLVLSQTPGVNGLVVESVTLPSGTTVVYPAVQLSGGDFANVVPSGDTVSWSYLSLVEGNAPANLVFDSALVAALEADNASWKVTGTIGTGNGDINVVNAGTDDAAWVIYGSGSAQGYQQTQTTPFAVNPGSTYTLSANITNPSGASGAVSVDLFNPPVSVGYGGISQNPGASGQLSTQITIPSGVTAVVVIIDCDNNTFPAGSAIVVSQIQLTETSTVQPYAPGIVPQAGPLWTYPVYRNGAEIGSTTALAFEDTGQTAGAAPPTTNTSGETHWVTNVGVFQQSALSYMLEVLSDSPLAYWPLDEASGATTVHDASANGNVGTVNGGVTFGQPGVIESFPEETAAEFDGSTGYISTAYAPSLPSAFTAEAWAYPANLSAGCDVVTMRSGGNACGIICNVNANGTVSFGGSVFPNANDYFFESTQRAQNQWYHLVYTWDFMSGGVLYVDGAVAYNQTGAIGPNALSADWWIAGGDREGYGGWFRGDISQVAVYATALSASRIQAHYNAASAVLFTTANAQTALYELPVADQGASSGANITGLLSMNTANTPLDCTASLYWYQANGDPSAITPVSSGTAQLDAVTPNVASITVTAEPPSDATQVQLSVLINNALAKTHNVTQAALLTGSTAIYAPSGNTIWTADNLGIAGNGTLEQVQ